jgi:UbiD family decarboxylase
VAIGVHPAVTLACCTRVPKGKELPYAAELLGGGDTGTLLQQRGSCS